MLVVLFDEERHRFRRKIEGLRLIHAVEEIPQGLVFARASEDFDELLEFERGGLVIGLGQGPVEEAVRFGWGGGASAEDAEDELGGDAEAELVEGAFEVEIAPYDV